MYFKNNQIIKYYLNFVQNKILHLKVKFYQLLKKRMIPYQKLDNLL